MEHVLLYSKINSQRKKSLSASGPDFTATTPSSGEIDTPATFDLCTMVEETVESSVFAHRHSTDTASSTNTTISSRQPSQPSPDPSSRGPLVLVVIEARTSWKIRSEIGNWRRILLNLLGNALKYTSSGLITVTLARGKRDATTLNSSEMVELVVTDTGRGMSQTYLQNHLYTPFTQENNLSPGVGLGLSIVRSLVDILNGSVHISSEQGVGTTVTLRLPALVLEEPAETQKEVYLERKGQKVYFLGPKSNLRPPRQEVVVNAFKDQVKNWLGVDVIDANDLSSIGAGTLVILEDDIPWLIAAQDNNISNSEIPANSCLLVLGMATSTEILAKAQPRRKVQTLSVPFGPRKLAKAMKACFDLVITRNGETNTGLAGADTTVNQSSIPSHPIEPLQDLTLSASEPASSHLPTNTTAVSKPVSLNHNLLLVDDNAINLKLLVTFASKLGCTFTAVSNGREALEAYQTSRERFNYVLMDLSMPIMDGFAATSAIRSFERAQGLTSTVVMALSGLGSQKDRQEAANCGMDLFLTKPVSLKRLQQILTPRTGSSSTYSGS
ncbi:hypothetical protein H2200_009940 [Cladophialophora chaetospira]|uniref:histidine kinase n=1 Tax=Cladophialophora chaetospira TaxID=386627 RepID=A0AA38X1W1_9EURO|nr:hypothetical protein H2200_009940 [Cladophialophora chaetospira]